MSTLPAENSDQIRSMTETRALRMLAAGDDLASIIASTGLTKDELARLQRDFPGTSRVATSVAAPTQPDPLGRLLALGAKHRSKRAQNLAAKVTADVARLREILAGDAEKEAARRKAEEAKAAAKAEVARLEAELRAAKARLGGRTATTSADRTCEKCGTPVERPGTRGPWPKRCAACR